MNRNVYGFQGVGKCAGRNGGAGFDAKAAQCDAQFQETALRAAQRGAGFDKKYGVC